MNSRSLETSEDLVRDVQCPWGSNLNSVESCKNVTSLLDVMSEELAENLNIRETVVAEPEDSLADVGDAAVNPFESTSADTCNDMLLAQMLQYEYDREFDGNLKREERHVNKNSKVSISFNNYKLCPEWYGTDSEDEDVNIDDFPRTLDSFEERERNEPIIPACGYTTHHSKIVTKHDNRIAGRKNAERVMNLHPGVNTGDGGGFDMNLSNKVFNHLVHSTKKEANRKHRVHDKAEKATAEQSLDPTTRLVIFKMVNNGILESVNGMISTGKEAAVFHAMGGSFEEKRLPAECAVKVFKTSLTDFKTRERYIKDDYRFKNRMSKNNNRMTIQMWAEKEFHNLTRLQRAEIASPKPLLIKKHVLVMSFIGENQIAAPKLKNVVLGSSDWERAFNQVVEAMTSMFQDCSLVHGDMSEYNILWHENRCWIIDLGQAVEPIHPNALKFLYRDCSNIVRFFESKGVSPLPSPLKLFTRVSRIVLKGSGEDAVVLIEQYQNSHEALEASKKSDQFEHLWGEMQKKDSMLKASDGMMEDQSPDEENAVLSSTTPPKQGVMKKRGRKSKSKNTPQMYEGVVNCAKGDA